MIIDTLENSATYFGLNKNFEVAFEYLKAQNLGELEVGTYTVSDDVVFFVTDKDGVTAEAAAQKFECHNKNIDIQVCIRGHETLGWKPRADCTQPKGEYNEEKDFLLYADAPDTHFSLKSGQFAIFYPEDVHAPMIGEGPIKKLVVKVKI